MQPNSRILPVLYGVLGVSAIRTGKGTSLRLGDALLSSPPNQETKSRGRRVHQCLGGRRTMSSTCSARRRKGGTASFGLWTR
jgi:hypothetical protein